jgi:Ca-activated chloride channel homolog
MKIALIILFYISALGWAWGDSLASNNKEANKLYKEGKIDDALSKWRDAQIENPDNDKLHYNIGNGLHEQKKYDDAFKEYEKSLDSKDSELRHRAYYNIGNTHYRMGKLPEAIEDYKKCLEIDPKDEDAKYNIEFIKKKLEEQKKQESQKNNDKNRNEQQDKSKSSESREDQQDKQQSGQEEKKEETQAKEEKDKPEQQGSEEKPAAEENKDQMSKEDAVRLLDAMKDDEKDLQKELRKQPAEGRYNVDKDW